MGCTKDDCAKAGCGDKCRQYKEGRNTDRKSCQPQKTEKWMDRQLLVACLAFDGAEPVMSVVLGGWCPPPGAPEITVSSSVTVVLVLVF